MRSLTAENMLERRAQQSRQAVRSSGPWQKLSIYTKSSSGRRLNDMGSCNAGRRSATQQPIGRRDISSTARRGLRRTVRGGGVGVAVDVVGCAVVWC